MFRLTNLDKCGVSVDILDDGSTRVFKFDPIPMIDWSDMRKADVLLVGGGILPGAIIRLWNRLKF